MTVEQIEDMHRARPFKPFVIHVADGRSFRVDHPEFLAQLPGSRIISVGVPERGTFQLIDLPLITGIEYANGTHRTRRRKA